MKGMKTMADKRLIDADAFIEDIKTEITELFMNGLKGTPQPRDHLYDFVNRIGEQPTVDAVEVVRCMDCAYWDKAKSNKKGFLICPASGMEITADDFCSYGERKDNG